MREMLKRLKSRSNIEEEGIGREKGVFSDHESSFLTWLNERGSLLPLHQKEYSRVEHRRLREGYEAEMLRLTMQTPTFRTFKNY